jgi:hypothetical protein
LNDLFSSIYMYLYNTILHLSRNIFQSFLPFKFLKIFYTFRRLYVQTLYVRYFYTFRFIRSDVIRSVFIRSDVICSDVIRSVIIRSVGEPLAPLKNAIDQARYIADAVNKELADPGETVLRGFGK